jgi:hypothetical protein
MEDDYDDDDEDGPLGPPDGQATVAAAAGPAAAAACSCDDGGAVHGLRRRCCLGGGDLQASSQRRCRRGCSLGRKTATESTLATNSVGRPSPPPAPAAASLAPRWMLIKNDHYLVAIAQLELVAPAAERVVSSAAIAPQLILSSEPTPAEPPPPLHSAPLHSSRHLVHLSSQSNTLGSLCSIAH